jgi:hypothetical protein
MSHEKEWCNGVMEHMFKNGILNAFNLFPNEIFKMEKTCMILPNELFKMKKHA